MKIPERPPTREQWKAELQPESIVDFWGVVESGLRDRYLHWDEVRRREPPQGLSSVAWWALLRLQRSGQLKPIPLFASDDAPALGGYAGCRPSTAR